MEVLIKGMSVVLNVNVMNQILPYLGFFLFFSFFAAACTPGADPTKETEIPVSPTTTQNLRGSATATSEISQPVAEPTVSPKPDPANPADIPDYFPSIPFDGILPIYNPQFGTVNEVATLMFDDELVMGVAWGGEAKAYPVTVLRFREIVNDELAGIPTLVSW